MDFARVSGGLIAAACAGLCGAAGVRAEGLDYEVFDGTGGHSADAPIVMVLHGALGSGPDIRKASEFDKWASAEGVVAVYPSGEKRVWNDGRFDGDPSKAEITARYDVERLLSLAQELDRKGLGDAQRLYVIGHSNGGGMAMQIACARPDAVRGIAVVATKIPEAAPCAHPMTPVPAVFFYGTSDAINPPEGRHDMNNRRDRTLGPSMSAADSLAVWSKRNGCTGTRPDIRIDPADDGVTVLRRDYSGCEAPLRYFETQGGGHLWPGVRPGLIGQMIVGHEAYVRDIDAGQEAMRFFFGD
jgi:polyhydroxybutyrate depolymerase